MIFKVAKKLNLSLSDWVVIGDNQSDIETGNAAGVGRIYINKPINKIDCESRLNELNNFHNLLSCAKYIYEHDKI